MANWVSEKVTELMNTNTNTAAVMDDFYAHGTGGSYRLVFEPKGSEIWVDDGSEDGFYYPRKTHTIKFGWESRIGEESNYFESVYEVDENNINNITEEVIEDWFAARCQFYPERPDE